MTVSKSLVRASRIMAVLSWAGAVLFLLMPILIFVFPDQTKALNMHMSHVDGLTGAVPLTDRLLALACDLVPAGIAAWGLLALAQLFRLFSLGQIFSPANLRALSRVATAMFWYVVTTFVMQAPVSYLLSHHNPPGHRMISLGFGSDDIEVLFLAGATFVIARVMAEARRMADENAGFV
jgi:Na+-driven multidrug efflux pump